MIVFWFYFAFLVVILLFVWGFFLVAKIHTYKFKEYSTHIRPVTRIVGAILLALTFVGFYAVFRELGTSKPAETTIKKSNIQETY